MKENDFCLNHHQGIRNMFGGLGPLAVSILASSNPEWELRGALLLAPACYFIAAGWWWIAEDRIEQERKIGEQMLLQQQTTNSFVNDV